MCQYCGCRDIPLIRDFIHEHARVLDLGRHAVHAIDRGELDTARGLLTDMAGELVPHWRGEENGLFAVMAKDDTVAEHLAPLIREHRELDRLLATVDLTAPEGQQAVRDAVDELFEHIRREEDGIFPAALTSLDGDEWDVAIASWHEAHPGREMVRFNV
ncbi:hemerythrin domain-containing protein [Mycolicibacterium flavescens]|uniref:Hemerythrin n=1 Tax=Mycolicibacterium flavescens TaxID=1776 RepID=A0A1E3RP68_MYCFV|nr:hemerythrin domain-containing protein [Mycolicibacterium flavescens]MCV7278275.1 hemerythrin domain-containing protein [Mycolicibacterium flavescens]ODQ91696.1 hemerythrin [Mycolicibacterium flavescens]